VKRLVNPVHPQLFPVIIFLIAGILAGNARPDTPFVIYAPVCLIVLFSISFFIVKLKPFVFGLSFMAMAWGFFSIAGVLNPVFPYDHISNYTDSSKYTITGRVVSFSKHYFHKQRITLDCSSLEKKDNEPDQVNGRIIVNIYGNQGVFFQYGDIIQFKSPLKPIRNFSNPKGFEYEKYMKSRGIFGSAYAYSQKITKLTQYPIPFYTKIIRIIEQVRNRFFYFTMDTMENKDAAAILTALITGKKEVIPLELRDIFSKAGASHILAISGLHLSIVALIFFFLFYFLLARFPQILITGTAKKAAGILTLVPLFFYAVFSGFSPSTQRAFIMTAVFMVSFMGEKENDPLNTLALAAALILIMDSTALLSISFQLSFTALFFIIIGFSLIRKRGWILKKNILTTVIIAALVTFFAGLGTFPLIAHYFNMVSHVQIMANLLLVPLMGFICLPLGFLALFFLFFYPSLSMIFADLCQVILGFCIGYIKYLTGFSFSWSRIITLTALEVALIYLFLGAVFLYLFRQKKIGIVLLTMVLLSGVLCVGIGVKDKFFSGKMTITILDVGQGNSALIQTIEGKNILVDGGGFSGQFSFDLGRYVVAPFLWTKKILNLDAVILTHPESDHLKGLVYIFENFKVNMLIKNQDITSSKAFKDIITLCHEKNIKIWHPGPGDKKLNFSKTCLSFYVSGPGQFSPGLNNNSLVFKIRYDLFSMVFPGDILFEREMILSKKKDKSLASLILLSPHHGSASSSSKIFLDKVNSESVIISCGYKNRYGFPNQNVLENYYSRGYKVFRTDLDGAVTISSDGIVYHIVTHKGG
jgi:competence protein ComEC